MMLRLDNLTSMRIGMPFERLSKTFQDAIDVVLNLGYHYLWIDSLCIVQDSKCDWLREAALMKEVYQNALFTISATNPRALEEGLSSIRPFGVADSVIQHVRFGTSSSTKKAVRVTLRDALWGALISKTPITKRAWTLQERILSQRILHFASHQLAWECDELEACELYPAGLLDYIPENYLRRKKMKPTPNTPSQAHGEGDIRRSYYGAANAWMSVVRSYSRCDLTNASDKLIALSGVTQYYQNQLLGHDTYLAGLWRKIFAEELTWIPASRGKTCRRAKQYRAPSWSWAAVDGPVIFAFITGRCIRQYSVDVEIIDIRTDLLDPGNPTGGGTSRYCNSQRRTHRTVLATSSSIP
jgi:hypothetical protein